MAAKFEQHAEALNRLEKTFGGQWKKTKDVADKILDSIEATERERLYGLYTQIDIKELKPEEPVAKPGWFCTGSCSFSPYGLQNCIFNRLLLQN